MFQVSVFIPSQFYFMFFFFKYNFMNNIYLVQNYDFASEKPT